MKTNPKNTLQKPQKKLALLNLNGWLFFYLIIMVLFTANYSNAVSSNLLVNPNAETKDMSGWTISQSGGNGWGISSGFDGKYSFINSYEWCAKYQIIDLIAKGYSQSQLDSSPTIYIEEWARSVCYDYLEDTYQLKVELRNASNQVIQSFDTGATTVPCSWTKKSYSFQGYGTGLRYIYFEHGGKDSEYWAGYYGSLIDNSIVMLDSSANEAPYFTMLDVFNYTGTPAVLGDNVTVRDIDSSDFNNGYLQVSVISGAENSDELSINNQGTSSEQIGLNGTTVTYSGTAIGQATGLSSGTITIAFNANSSTSSVETLIKNITYQNLQTGIANKTIQFLLNDGDGGSHSLEKSITLKLYQSIYFNSFPELTRNDSPYPLTASASSGLEVTYTSSNESVATISGSILNILNAGTSTITAYQSGNSQYNAAVPVSMELIVMPSYYVSGKVTYYETGLPVPDVTINMTGYLEYSTSSDIYGDYTFTDLPQGHDYTITLEKYDNVPYSGLDSSDAILIAQYVVGIGSTFTNFKKISADVTGDGTISSTDASRVVRFADSIITLLNEQEIYWKFVYGQLEVSNVWPYTYEKGMLRLTSLSSNMAGQNFVAIKLGDVNADAANNH